MYTLIVSAFWVNEFVDGIDGLDDEGGIVVVVAWDVDDGVVDDDDSLDDGLVVDDDGVVVVVAWSNLDVDTCDVVIVAGPGTVTWRYLKRTFLSWVCWKGEARKKKKIAK